MQKGLPSTVNTRGDAGALKGWATQLKFLGVVVSVVHLSIGPSVGLSVYLHRTETASWSHITGFTMDTGYYQSALMEFTPFWTPWVECLNDLCIAPFGVLFVASLYTWVASEIWGFAVVYGLLRILQREWMSALG